MKDYEILRDLKSLSLKEFSLGPLAERGLSLGDIQWSFIEETAVGLAPSGLSRILYAFFPAGLKISAFSGTRINQALIFSSQPEEWEEAQTAYYRACRRFQNKDRRLEFLGLESSENLKEKIQNLLLVQAFNGTLKDRFAISFLAHEKSHQESFNRICLEYRASRLRTLLVFPQTLSEEELIDQESMLFQGELEEDQVPYFLQAMLEDGLDIHEISFSASLRLPEPREGLTLKF